MRPLQGDNDLADNAAFALTNLLPLQQFMGVGIQ